MPSRRVTIDKLENGAVVAILDQSGDVSEEMIEREFLAIIYKADPALDDDTGRLVPGARNSEISLSLYLTEPDLDGVSHLGGIRGAEPIFHAVIEELSKNGYEVKYGRV